MSEVLISLRNYCDHLDSDKVTERKKRIESLKRELNRPLVQRQLDHNSDGGRGFTWNSAFKAVSAYMLKEAEYLKKNKGVSSTSTSIRDRKKQEVGAVFKWFVRVANQRGECLKCSSVVQHILELMKDEFTASAFGVDCCSVLQKDLLRSRKYYCELPQSAWHELLIQFCKALHNPSSGLSQDLLSRIVRSILAGATVQSTVRRSSMLNFFTRMVSKLRLERSATVIENILAALNTFCLTVASDCRKQLCKLGEESLSNLMHVWRNNSAAPVKDEVIDFLRLQMRLHHPQGVLKEGDGAYAADLAVWKSHLQQLYELIYDEWKQAGTRMKLKGTGSREIVFKAALVDLAADVCRQVFSENYSSIEVSQVIPESSQSSSSSRPFPQGGGGAKRRKVEPGWSMLRDTVATLGQSANVTPWLQLMRALLHKYPTSLPEDQLLPLVSSLQQVQAETKRAEIQTWILQTLQALVVCKCERRNLPTGMRMALHTEWTKVWSCVIRTISLHTAESDGFDLLTCLLHHGIANPDREHWRLFMPDSTPPTRNSVQFLATYLKHHSLPENYICKGSGILVSGSAVTKGNFPLRHQLLSWLLPTEEQDEPGERLQLVKLLKCLPTTLVAHVLGALTQCTTQSIPCVTTHTRPPAATLTKTERTLQEAETLYLRSSFDSSEAKSLEGVNDVGRSVVGSSSVVSSVKQSLMQGLEKVGVQVLDFSSSEASCVEALIHYASLLCKTLAVLLELGVLSEREIGQSKLTESLKTLLKRVTTALRTLWHKSDATTDAKIRLQSLSSLITALDGMLTWNHSFASQVAEGSVSWLAETCRAITSNELLDTLFEIVQKKGNSSTSSKSTASRTPAKDPFDDEHMDTEFDDEFDGNGKDDFDENSNLADDSSGHKACQSLLSPDALSEAEHLALKSAQLLCSWCFTGRSSPQGQRSGRGQMPLSTSDVQDKLLELVEQEAFDASAAFDVQLFFTIAEAFIASTEKQQDEILSRLLYSLRTVASTNRKDQELCASILSLLSRLVPLLQSDTLVVSTDLKESRDVTLRLLAAFWKLQREGDYTAPVRLAIAKCMHALVLIDPARKWTVLRSKGRERGQGDHDPTVSGEFCLLLTDGSHSVRMHMASAIKCLFCGNGKPFTKEIQNQSFDTVYQMVQDAMELQGKLTPDEQAEESANRTASLLATLSTVACCSPACEKKTVFALMQAIQLNGIEISLMQKVLQSISDSLLYSSVTAFLESHLSYLIHQWLLEKYLLPQFPYQLLACPTEVDFYRRYHGAVIPHLVTLQSLDTLRDIAQALDSDWIQLLKDAFPQSIAHILPLFGHTRAADEDVESAEYKERRILAVSCFEALENTLGKETINNMIQGHLDSIVVELLAMLYEPHTDDSDVAQFTSDTDPEPNPPFFTTYTIKATLDYLTKCHAGSKALTLVSLLAKTQDNIQKILLALHIKISKSHRAHEKHRMVLAYRLFVSLLLAELPTGLGGSWAMVLQDVIYTLVHTIQEGAESGEGEGLRLARPCVDLLHAVCVTGLENCHEELGKHLHVIMGALVPLVEKKDKVAKEALSLINLLVIDNAASLSGALKYLDPLPDSPRLARAKAAQRSNKYTKSQFTLMEEVNHFLMLGSQQAGILRVEGLKHLHHQLATRKEELSVMVQQCAEGSDRTIIQLITELVDLSGNKDGRLDSPDNMAQVVKEEAARCLGDIGAPNLSTVALHCEETEKNACYSTALKVFAKDPIMSRHVVIIHLLKEYLTDPNVDTVEAAANCLKTVLATTWGQRCYDMYKDRNIDKLFYYLNPFKPSKKKVVSKQAPRCSSASFAQTIGDPSLWQPAGGNHSDWVRNLTIALIRSGGLQDEILLLLEPICKVKVEFAENVLPYLFHDILSTGNDLYRRVLSQRMEAVFTGHCNSAIGSRAPTPVPFADISSSQLGQRSIRTLLDVMHYLRTQERPTQSRTKSTAWDNNFWLDVNYLLVAKAAQNCRAHFTCLLYTEIWCDVQRSRQLSSLGRGSQSFSQPSDIETLSSMSNDANINVQSLLLEAYSSIGEPDGVYGCGAGRLTDTYARIHTYEHEGDWSKALSAYDLKLHSKSSQTGTQEVGVLQAMQNLGLSHIMTVYLQGLRSEEVTFGPEMVQFQYEAAWRNALWDMELDDRNQTNSNGYHQSLYTALSCLRDGESESFTVALQQARKDTLHQLCHVSIESAYSVYPMLSRLQGLVEMEDFGAMLLKNQQPNSVLQSWTSQLALMDNDFEFAEPTLALRTVLLQLLLEKSDANNRTQAYEGLVAHLKNHTEIARKAESFQIAEKALATLHDLHRPEELQTDHSWWRLIEEAKVYWTRNEKTTAMHLMKALLDKISRVSMDDPVAESLHPEVLTIYGNWQAETNSDSPNVIIEQYFERAVDMYDLRDDTSPPAIESQLSLARFADTQYQNIVNYMKSSEYEDKQALMKQAKKEYEELLAMGDRVSRYARTLEKQSEIDERELGSMMQDRENFLHRAVECYLKCLEFGTAEHDMRVFRVCSLWFDNSNEDEINQLIQSSFERIASRKLLPLLYQLAARMTTKTQDKQLFHDVLNELIERTAQDHPHHALPIILALANANKDAIITSKRTGRLARANSMKDDTSHADESRMQAAQHMLGRLRSTRCQQIIRDLEKLSDSYIELAYWDVSDRKREIGPIKLPPNQPLTQLKNLEHVAMPTMEIPVDASCRYDNIVSVSHFEGTFKLAGGVNLPKIITCVGSDGIRRRQLVKGKDDLRQDAVMQQVFSLVNKLLQRNQETRKRRLQIRTYKIVPLSQRSGLLEWCEGTMPIGEYLIGNQKTDFGAHKRYRPQDNTSMECRKKMAMAHSSSEQGKKYKEFREVMKRFQPVFRHFFLEKFPDPAVWLERRLAYTRSVATSSIVGYVVGLGDRHVQNILIDCNLAELVHIDLGVAFEQGRILPTPETVPFRLTRDLVDGMGIAGVEGVFRRCCEKTMDVMHNSQEALLTILQVLLYDPLYVWTMSPHKAMALQQRRDRNDPDASELNTTSTDLTDGDLGVKGQEVSSDEGTEVNKVAERVVLRLRQKLQGVEEGVAMSVKGQVNRLIQEARDPKNLCRLFPGWQPWI
ncbi:serine-protein kinase ATM-like [Patiria miniata]|uniref:non-specific serine/threonine protein kinase n=1 Tax=Patiria miniata TaxID=46514 RepID=A0A914BM46_PATMI|nr:serine-protein kinase ATM-like [Patiria miniata]